MAIFNYNLPASKFKVIDLIIMIFVFLFLFAIVYLGTGMIAPFSPEDEVGISSNPLDLPYYAGRSLLRMFIAYFAAIIFTLVYGSIAAKSKSAEKIFIPLLDILQSVPVLGFLSVTVTLFIALFPGSLMGVEMASIFAIFTGQCWNMTFSFYHSLVTIPNDLKEAATGLKLNWWQKFIRLEVPFAMTGLVWNSIASFGNGWFFLAASEAITVLNKSVFLPGIGSFMASAASRGDMTGLLYSILTMGIIIIFLDIFFWRPIMAWAQKFKFGQSEETPPTSFVYDIMQRSSFIKGIKEYVLNPIGRFINFLFNSLANFTTSTNSNLAPKNKNLFYTILKIIVILIFGYYTVIWGMQATVLVSAMNLQTVMHIINLGFNTFLRVMAACLLGVLWTVPLGVLIGTNQKLSRIFQPIVQIAASFPANMFYPFIAAFYLNYSINFEFGSIPLMMLGTQWYILFNVIAGATSIRNDLKDASNIFKLSGISKWRRLILPSIFPYLITGCIAASGGAWNASIVSEFVVWEGTALKATGLGTYISEVTAIGDWAGIIMGITIMCAFVVIANRIFWSKLYKLAETKYNPY